MPAICRLPAFDAMRLGVAEGKGGDRGEVKSLLIADCRLLIADC